MKTNKNVIFSVFIIILFAALLAPPLYGEDLPGTEVWIEGTDISSKVSLDLWHYSGGYWQVGNAGSDKITVSNEEMEDRGISAILATEYAEFTIPLPVQIKQKISEGSVVVARAATDSTPLSEIFDTATYTLNIVGDNLYFKAKPIFNLIPEQVLSFADYGLALSSEVPLIDKAYGYNIYSLFGNGESGAQAAGRVSRLAPGAVESGYVHPSMITGLDGALEGGHTIYIRGGAVGSAGYTVGQGTFAAGGAVGLSFSYPVKFQFYEVTEEVVPPVVTPPAIVTPSGIETGVTAILDLPPKTFEGHPAFAVDSSVFQTGDEEISAVRAYAENLADNSFHIVQSGAGNLSRLTATQAEATFFNPGLYHVRLDVQTHSGQTGEDVKPITVERTPYIIHTLGGVQKQNRKQTLSIAVAQNPLHPIVRLRVELEDPSAGNSVHLIHPFDGSPGALQNSLTIKTRAIAQEESTAYFVNVSLDFLTKNRENQDFIYRIFAEDSRGSTDSVEVIFPVAKDHPPLAVIGLAASFLREPASNTAVIDVQDESATDGDQLERIWSCGWGSLPVAGLETLPGYKDLSFGTGQTVQFHKEGVGKFDVLLEIKDLWVEETLEEYISGADYLTAAAIKSSEVDNVAPRVTLETFPSHTAEILLLTVDKALYQAARDGKGELSRILLSEGIDADITVEYVRSDSQSEQELIQNIGKLTVPYGFQGTWSGFWESDSVASDRTQIYKAEATWSPGSTVYECYPSQPYTIRAYDRETLAQVWAYTLSAEHFPMGSDRGSTAFFGQDNQGRFLYFMIAGRTILLDKKTGAELAILPYLMGESNSVYGDSIFSFKSDGIYRISMEDGSLRKVVNEKIFTGKGAVVTIGGKEVFLVQRGIQLLRAVYDTKSQTLDLRRLQGTDTDSGGALTYLAGIDSTGVIVTNTVEGTSANLRAFSPTGQLLHSSAAKVEENFPDCTVPVYDAAGRINYLGIRTYKKTSTAYYVSVALRGLYDGYSGTVSVSNTQGYPTERDSILFGAEKKDGTVLVGLGALWTYIADSGYNSGPVHGLPQRAKVFRFNPAAGTAAQGALSDLCPGLETIAEYGVYSDGSLLISTGANDQTAELAYHSTSLIDIFQTPQSRMESLRKKHLAYEADYTLCREIQTGFSPETIARELLEKAGQGENILELSTQTSEGSLSKNYNLNAGRTYYYEYTTTSEKDILSATAYFEQTGRDSVSGSAVYAVSEEYFEDFNDPGINSYFTLQESKVNAGVYDMAVVHLDQGSDWSNKYVARSSYITFSIPSGFSGVLSFDYDILRDSGWMGNFFTLSKDSGPEQVWDEWVTGTQKGHYMHKELLTPGNYTLTAYARAYGGRVMDAHTKIDRLQVLLVSRLQNPEPFEASRKLPSVSSVRPSGSQNTVKGSFTAPGSISTFSRLHTEVAESPGDTPYSIVSGQPGSYRQTVSIPVGRTALYLDLNTWSSPSITGDDNYNNVTFTWSGNQWICMLDNPTPQSAMTNIPKSYRLVRRGLTGLQIIEQRSTVYRNSTGGFSGIRMVLSDPGFDVPAEVSGGDFFLSDSALYFKSAGFGERVQIDLSLGRIGSAQLGDLKIYSIEDGVRIYVENTSFRREEVLQEWTAFEAAANVTTAGEETQEAAALMYQKGDLLSYGIFYSDYEADPSKSSYWKYTHTPMNDGLHPLSGVVLTAPIPRFYLDGKYVLEHWQQDDASRSGGSPYDRDSNVCVLPFYIEGTAEAPWITSIRTDPIPVEYSDFYSIKVGVDDTEKDVLELTTELYHEDSPGVPVYTHVRTGLEADIPGSYPVTTIPVPYSAVAGRYDVVATVRDETGAGLGTYRFYCLFPMEITGEVFHTEAWENNRRLYNLQRFGEEYNDAADFALYSALPSPRPRGTNVFWPGERLCLAAQVAGNPLYVSAVLAGHPLYTTDLTKAGFPDALGKTRYEGALWTADMVARLGAAPAHPETVIFTAIYTGGARVTHEVQIIFDRNTGYWQLHRLY